MVKNLKQLRERAKMSQQAVADHIGVSQQSINKYENQPIEPDIEHLIALADLFNTTIDYLVGRDTSPQEADSLSPIEKSLVSNFRTLSPFEQRNIMFIEDEISSGRLKWER